MPNEPENTILAAEQFEDSSFRLEAAPVEILAAADGDKDDEAKKFNCLAYNGGVMTPSMPGIPIVMNLAGMKASSNLIAVLRDHDTRQPVGQGTLQIEDGKVRVTGSLCGPDEHVKPIVQASKRGFVWRASLGGSLADLKYIAEGESVKVNGATHKGPVYVAGKSLISEVSFLAIAADGKTTVKIAAMATGVNNMDPKFKTWLEASGFENPESLKAEQVKALEAAWKAEVKASEKTEEATPAAPAAPLKAAQAVEQPDVEAVIKANREKLAAESERVAAIEDLAAKYDFEGSRKIIAQATKEGWEPTKVELELLRANRKPAPAVHTGATQSVNDDVLLAACFQSGKLQTEQMEKRFDAKVLEAADKTFHGRMGLQQLLLEAALANGYNGRYFRDNPRDVLRYAFGDARLSAAGSAVNISGILSNVANKFLLEGFFAVERVWREICTVRSVNDFKEVTAYRMTGANQYKKVAPGGEIKHGTLAEESFTNKAETYGLMLDISRTDIVNDDLGAITTVPRVLGRGSGLSINDVFWTEFMDNSTFFLADNNNYVATSTCALGITGLTEVEKEFMDQVDADGKPLGLSPAILLVSTDNTAMAAALFNSMEIRDTTASTKYPVANPHAGKFKNLVSRYLNNTSYTGYSTTAYYLLANPQDCSTIEVVFLNGNESPTIETADADFNRLGIQMRGYHDFGVNKQDPRGGVKSNGTT